MPNPIFARTVDSIQKGLKDQGLPSISDAVAQNGEVIWQQAFGWANKENKIKATPNTVYPLGS